MSELRKEHKEFVEKNMNYQTAKTVFESIKIEPKFVPK